MFIFIIYRPRTESVLKHIYLIGWRQAYLIVQKSNMEKKKELIRIVFVVRKKLVNKHCFPTESPQVLHSFLFYLFNNHRLIKYEFILLK